MIAPVRHLRMITGSADIISHIEGLIEQARAGEIDGLMSVVCTTDEMIQLGVTIKPDIPHRWARLVAGAADLKHYLISGEVL